MLDTAATASHLHRESHVTNKPIISVPNKPNKISHPGMMGDGTEEQNLNERVIRLSESSRTRWTLPSARRRRKSPERSTCIYMP